MDISDSVSMQKWIFLTVCICKKWIFLTVSMQKRIFSDIVSMQNGIFLTVCLCKSGYFGQCAKAKNLPLFFSYWLKIKRSFIGPLLIGIMGLAKRGSFSLLYSSLFTISFIR